MTVTGTPEPSTQPRNERAIAHHEAGHAMVLFALGRTIVSVTIEPEGEYGGNATAHPVQALRERLTASPRQRKAFEDYIVLCLAGAIAEAHYRGVDVREVADAAADDYDKIEKHLYELEPQTVAGALLAYLEVRARDIVFVHWYLIEALAAELLKRRTISGAAVHRLLRQVIRDQAAQSEMFNDGQSEGKSAGAYRQIADLMGRELLGWPETFDE